MHRPAIVQLKCGLMIFKSITEINEWFSLQNLREEGGGVNGIFEVFRHSDLSTVLLLF